MSVIAIFEPTQMGRDTLRRCHCCQKLVDVSVNEVCPYCSDVDDRLAKHRGDAE